MEIVSEPDIQTPAEAMAYCEKLRALLRWIGVSTANMEDGALRIDANISVWPEGEPIGDVKVEVKNMNSFRSLGRALAFEIERQTGRRERGQPIEQETRGWDESAGVTRVPAHQGIRPRLPLLPRTRPAAPPTSPATASTPSAPPSPACPTRSPPT